MYLFHPSVGVYSKKIAVFSSPWVTFASVTGRKNLVCFFFSVMRSSSPLVWLTCQCSQTASLLIYQGVHDSRSLQRHFEEFHVYLKTFNNQTMLTLLFVIVEDKSTLEDWQRTWTYLLLKHETYTFWSMVLWSMDDGGHMRVVLQAQYFNIILSLFAPLLNFWCTWFSFIFSSADGETLGVKGLRLKVILSSLSSC